MAVEILFVGDMHIGRRPSRLPANLPEYEIQPTELGPAAAWRRVVKLAIQRRVDAVVLAGDVVQEENDRFEAFGPLLEGARALAEHDVQLLAVAGNHDVDALPRLAEVLPDFELLGSGGRWEWATIRRGGEPVARLLGWSFPSRRHSESPLAAEIPPPPAGELPSFGVLHAHLDASKSPHAPVPRGGLERVGLTAWLLGHIHGPSEFPESGAPSDRDQPGAPVPADDSRTPADLFAPHPAPPSAPAPPNPARRERPPRQRAALPAAAPGVSPVGYLGSLVGLDPGEPGVHGPVLVSVGAHGNVSFERIPIAPLRWEEVSVPVDRLTSEADVLPLVKRALDALHEELAHGLGETRAVGCRLHWRGRTPWHRALRHLDPEELLEIRAPREGVLYFVHEVVDHARPALDLARVARSEDPPGLVARALEALEEAGPDGDALLREAARELARAADAPAFAALDPLELGTESVRELLLDAGLEALEELLAQAPEQVVAAADRGDRADSLPEGESR